MAAGSQERRMAERQANGRPGTDKGRGAGTLEAWVRGPGRGQCWYLILCAGASCRPESLPPGGVLLGFSGLNTIVILCPVPPPPPNLRAFSDLPLLAGPLVPCVWGREEGLGEQAPTC